MLSNVCEKFAGAPIASNGVVAPFVDLVQQADAIHWPSLGLAALAWILHPLALILASLLVLRELYRREFRSIVREALSEDRGG